MYAHTSLSQDGFQRRSLWVSEHQLTSVTISPLLTSKEPFCACVVREVSWLRKWRICGLFSSIWAGPSLLSQLSCYSCLRISVHKERTQTICPGGPSVSCLNTISSQISFLIIFGRIEGHQKIVWLVNYIFMHYIWSLCASVLEKGRNWLFFMNTALAKFDYSSSFSNFRLMSPGMRGMGGW